MGRPSSRPARRRPQCLDGRPFGVAVEPRAGEEPQPRGPLQREHAAVAGHGIDDQVRVFPVGELGFAHVEGRARDLAEQHVGIAEHEFAAGEAHGRAAVAAAAGLVEHERAVLCLQPLDEGDGLGRGRDTGCGSGGRGRRHAVSPVMGSALRAVCPKRSGCARPAAVHALRWYAGHVRRGRQCAAMSSTMRPWIWPLCMRANTSLMFSSLSVATVALT